jgi:hypothetical protein
MRSSPVTLVVLAVVLASCQPADSAPPLRTEVGAPVAAPSASPPAAAQVTSLAGDWRVAGIDGADFNESYGLALKGDDERLWWEPLCALQVRRYRITDGAIAFSSAYPPPSPGEPPPIVCQIAPPARLADVMRALDAAQSVERTPQNGILIAGGGHSVLLFSQ